MGLKRLELVSDVCSGGGVFENLPSDLLDLISE